MFTSQKFIEGSTFSVGSEVFKGESKILETEIFGGGGNILGFKFC